MASINYAAREISVKIVYYGPGLSGKTTNLQIIHKKVPKDFKSDMVSLATETDRTLFFDFLPLDLGKIKGFSAKFQLYTVPGQVYYNATRKLVLRGVDGVVFVADSAQDKMQENLESFQNLMDNLAEYGYKREQVPLIIQYNKRDLPNALPVQQLDQIINKYNVPWTEAAAIKGQGVFESLKLIGKIVIDELNRKYSRGSRKSGASRPQTQQAGQPTQAAQPQTMQQRPHPDAGRQPMQRPPMPPQQRPAASAPRPSMPPQPPRPEQTMPPQSHQWGAQQKPQTPPPPPGQPREHFAPPPPPPQRPQQFTPPPEPRRQQFADNAGAAPASHRPMPQNDPFINQPGAIPQNPMSGQYPGHNMQDNGYDSVNLEPMESTFDVGNSYAAGSQPEKSELDLEIERYQQEIYNQNGDVGETQYDYPGSQTPYETFEPQQPQQSYDPNDYQTFDQNKNYGHEYNSDYDQDQNYSFDPGAYDNNAYADPRGVQDNNSDSNDEATFEIPPSSQYPYGTDYEASQQQNQNYDYYQNQDYGNSYGYDQGQYDQPQYNEPPENDDKPMYFTSVDMDHPPKKGKKPVNPKSKQKKGLFGRFKKNHDEDDLFS